MLLLIPTDFESIYKKMAYNGKINL